MKPARLSLDPTFALAASLPPLSWNVLRLAAEHRTDKPVFAA
ncbi:MAG: hypothetical protein WCH98_14970 [Verrucomicrobiota bacterium]